MIAQQYPAPEPFTAGRLSKPTSALLQAYGEAPDLEKEIENLLVVLQVDTAHVIMLAQQKIIPEDQAGLLLLELNDLKRVGRDGFVTKPGYGSINLQIEAFLSQRLSPSIAGLLPIGRSRIDHGATVRRLAARLNILSVLDSLAALEETLFATAAKFGTTPTLSYTHMQQAQPATFGHYLLAFHDRFAERFEQLAQGYERLNASPLGTAGVAGTDLPIDRYLTASLLGFSRLVINSRSSRDAYYEVETVSTLALIMTTLNDLASDLHIQCSVEFGTVELDDSHCSTSSIFPQKKNTVALEKIKGRAADAHGWVAAAFASFRNEGTGDQAERKVACVNQACTQTAHMLQLMAEIIEKLSINEQRCKELLDKSWVTTNRLGNALLIKTGIDYRTAHGLVARLVKDCLAKGIRKSDVSVQMLYDAAVQMGIQELINITEDELRAALDYNDFLLSCNSVGGVGVQQFTPLLEASQQTCRENRSWIQAKEKHNSEANMRMENKAKRLRNVAAASA